MELNSCQTPIEELGLDTLPKEVQDQFWDFFNNVPYIQILTSKDRPRAKDLPRDEEGKIIIDISHPHILEDMDYFRPTAIHYQKTGRFTDLRPNGNPNSEYAKWIEEEVKRCWYGYVRKSDGEWITGDYYFFLNYCEILISKTEDEKQSVEDAENGEVKKKRVVRGKKRKANRTLSFPLVHEGQYLFTHYLELARENGNHAGELAARGKGKSYLGASLLSKRFTLGESQEVCEQVQCVVTAYERKYIQGANQILDMFKKYIDFLVLNTEFPSKRLTDSIQTLTWRMGYKDLDTGAERGTLNSVIGITSHDDESKLRGSRGVLYVIEEFGSFPRLLGTYNTMRPSVEDGDDVFGTIAMWGTAGDEDSDFASAQEIMYNPKGYNMYPIINVYDKHGQGRKFFVYFYPGYINRAKCYDINGNSDVTKALVEILMDRYTVKYNSTDANAITKRISEIPITPQEAILRSKGKIFPTTELTQRLNDIDNDPTFYDNVATGTLIINSNGEVEYKLTDDKPIRNFPHKDNKLEGAIEFYKMPEKDSNGRVFEGRYILGHDPVDSDEAETLSLTSTFVLDLFTDQIVCEWTGRYDVADKNFEMVRRICLFYNAKCMYEQNKKGMYSYFQRMGCLSYLADTPEYLRDRDVIKHIGTGNGAKGVNATAGVNDFADRRIRDWMLKVVPIPNPRYTGEPDSEEPETIDNFNLYNIPSRALLLEAIAYCKEGNYDRIRALGMLMIYREQYLILYGDDVQGGYEEDDGDSLADDDFFDRNS